MSLYDDYINSVSKRPFVAFLARKGSTESIGHAFVGLGVELDAGLRVYEKFFGLYPNDGALAAVRSIFGPTTGAINYDWADLVYDTEMRSWLDEDQTAAVQALLDKWKGDTPDYSLLANDGMNCSSFAAEVAQAVGLKVPPMAGATRPWKYIEKLKALN